MCTMVFLKAVLSGHKRLMKVEQIHGIPKIPRIPEVNCQEIWRDIKNEAQIIVYFPDSYVNSDRTPDREYMSTVILPDICCFAA